MSAHYTNDTYQTLSKSNILASWSCHTHAGIHSHPPSCIGHAASACRRHCGLLSHVWRGTQNPCCSLSSCRMCILLTQILQKEHSFLGEYITTKHSQMLLITTSLKNVMQLKIITSKVLIHNLELWTDINQLQLLVHVIMINTKCWITYGQLK